MHTILWPDRIRVPIGWAPPEFRDGDFPWVSGKYYRPNFNKAGFLPQDVPPNGGLMVDWTHPYTLNPDGTLTMGWIEPQKLTNPETMN